MHDGFDPGVDDFPNDSGDGDRPLPTSAQPVTLTLGPVTVELHTIEPCLLEYLAEFYPMHEGRVASPAWIVDARLGDGPGMARNPWGVRYRVDAGRHHLMLRAERLENLAITTRKCVREVMIAFCEQRHYVMLHASAVVGEHGVVVIAGDKGSGKTTLALRAALLHGYQYLSNESSTREAQTPAWC